MQLSAENLTCERGGRLVFRRVSFRLAGGEALLVTGRNGAGTSSLLRMIAGLVRIAAGRLVLEGGDAEAAIGEQAHYLGHLDALKPALRRRLSIARLAAVKRPLWLLDEPTSALDVASQERLVDLMRQHLAGGGLIVAATHGAIGLEEARELRMGAGG
ncbi:MAG: heme ABC exporter ATP-binding protein CcmA [Pseudolabrys sp.]